MILSNLIEVARISFHNSTSKPLYSVNSSKRVLQFCSSHSGLASFSIVNVVFGFVWRDLS